jgi:hypothetical protein
MSIQTLQKRLTILEAQFDKLRKEVDSNKAKSWQRAIDKYGGDEDLQAVFSAAMKLRESDRERARRKHRRRANKE